MILLLDDPDYRGSNGEEAARHKHSRANCSGDTEMTLPYLQESPKPVWDLVFILRRHPWVSWNSVRGHARDQETALALMGTMGKRVYCTHPTAGHRRVAGGGKRACGRVGRRAVTQR